MLYVDKYRPTSLDDLHYHSELSERLRALAGHEDFPHILFYGPPGAGKKTRIMALMQELFGKGAQKLKIEQRVFLNPSKRKIDVNVVSSNFHIEITPSDAGNYDRLVIQDILKDIAQTQQVDASARHKFKVVILNDADLLSRDAQSALRRTMEKYMANMRLVLCATSTARIIAPIRSRCLLMRVGAPSEAEMGKVLKHVAKKESFHVPDNVTRQIYEESNGNLRKAILILETLHMRSDDLSIPTKIAAPDWETYTRETADMIIAKQNPEQLVAIRARLYELLVHAIPARLILKTLLRFITPKVDEDVKAPIVAAAAMFDLRCRNGSKMIFHLEAFVAQVMAIHKGHLLNMDWD